jgi:hypothetical protein
MDTGLITTKSNYIEFDNSSVKIAITDGYLKFVDGYYPSGRFISDMTGVTGPTGSQGTIGATGPTGNIGVTGPSGSSSVTYAYSNSVSSDSIGSPIDKVSVTLPSTGNYIKYGVIEFTITGKGYYGFIQLNVNGTARESTSSATGVWRSNIFNYYYSGTSGDYIKIQFWGSDGTAQVKNALLIAQKI